MDVHGGRERPFKKEMQRGGESMSRHVRPKAILAGLVAVAAFWAGSVRAADFPGVVQGVVKGASGEALSGA